MTLNFRSEKWKMKIVMGRTKLFPEEKIRRELFLVQIRGYDSFCIVDCVKLEN